MCNTLRTYFSHLTWLRHLWVRPNICSIYLGFLPTQYILNERGMYMHENIVTVPNYEGTMDTNLNLGSWTISGWYYTCQGGEYQVIDRQFTSAKEYLSIRVDGNGQYFVDLLLEQTLTRKQFETGIYTTSGWNYFALSLERTSVIVYGVTQYFNTMKFYAGHSQFEVASINLQNL